MGVTYVVDKGRIGVDKDNRLYLKADSITLSWNNYASGLEPTEVEFVEDNYIGVILSSEDEDSDISDGMDIDYVLRSLGFDLTMKFHGSLEISNGGYIYDTTPGS